MEFDSKGQTFIAAASAGMSPLFLTGNAGTGKSTLIRHTLSMLKQQRQNVAVVAPTGAAALVVGGQTIHSFFRLPPQIITEKDLPFFSSSDRRRSLFRNLHTLIIDEASMVRVDLMDAIAGVLRRYGRDDSHPFGGTQVILVGDLFQLPPVVKEAAAAQYFEHMEYGSPFFFSARCFRDYPLQTHALTVVYRQEDAVFVDALNAVRLGAVTARHLDYLNGRHLRDFVPEEGWVTLTGTNASAEAENNRRLSMLETPAHVFDATSWGVIPTEVPAPRQLTFKEGAQVVFVANDPLRQWVNGSVGIIEGIPTDNTAGIHVRLTNGVGVVVQRHHWQALKQERNQEKKQIETESIGEYTQFPMKLGWAMTVHKAQGATLDRVAVDLGRGAFAAGQTYVALSRVRAYENLVLMRRLSMTDVQLDPAVIQFHRAQAVVS